MNAVWVIAVLAGAALFAVLIANGEGTPETPGTTSDKLSSFSSDDVRRAALDIVWPVVTPMSGYWGNTIDDCDRAQVIVDAKRKKFADYEPPRMRKAIMSWLDFEDRRIAEARADIISGTSVKRMQRYEDRREKEQKGKDAVLQALKQ